MLAGSGSPFVVIGFNTSIIDFSSVRFPKSLRNCLNCHLDSNGKDTLGREPHYRCEPFNDLKITPAAAVCSACHDGQEVRSHMTNTGGASFATLQQNIGATVNERCAACHGPGKEEDVRR